MYGILSPDDVEGPITPDELRRLKEVVRKLHVKCGHPTNRALYNMLKARGVGHRILTLAKEHRCEDCQEIKLPVPHKGVSLHGSETLWHTVQVDIGHFQVGPDTISVLFFIDEASRFMAAHELFRHPRAESRNATTEEVIRGIEQTWIQHHGVPNTMRCDPEGCFRGLALEEFCVTRGIELSPCPAEDHGQIGIVEASLGKIKDDIRALLRSQDADGFVAILRMVSAHNELDRAGGFAPAQWAYGRLPSLDNRLFEGGHSIPYHSTEGTMGTDLRANLQLRVKAEEQYRRSQAVLKISRALNSQTRPYQVFLPGDLVYYRRFKTPAQEASHPGLDHPKMGIARWYGPGRVLATETRSEVDPPQKKPGSTIWVICAGRLKRCSPHQLRHCSDRERVLAEQSEALTMPWSFNSLMHLVERGQFQRFDDVQDDEDLPEYRSREARQEKRARSRSVPPRGKQDPTRTATRAQSTGRATDRGERPPKDRVGAPSSKEIGEDRLRPDKRPASSAPSSHIAAAPSHGSALDQHPPFQAAVRRKQMHEIEGMTLNEVLQDPQAFHVEEGQETASVCMLTVPLPETKREMKGFIHDSNTWVSKKVKRGVDLKWHEIPADRIEDFQKAKAKEISNWVKEAAVKLASKDVPRSRLLKMRWIYTIKQDNSAKARLVIIGYQDPDLGVLTKTSPVMTRRTRGLFLTKCALHGWSALKGDVKAAFLQGLESEADRQIFAAPVGELVSALGGSPSDNVQILKACYGLANAPAQWYNSIAATMRDAGFKALQTEPCCWIVLEPQEDGSQAVVGMACAHVDDFLFAGSDSSATWRRAVDHLYETYRWSDWEADSYMHCDVHVVQRTDGSSALSHSDYCTSIEQIQVSKDRSDKDPVSESERQQLRGALGAIQWRVYQSGPQHGAKLSNLQSQITTATVHTLRETNKLIREVYQGRHVGLHYRDLNVSDPLQVVFVAWSDAAVGNRRDFSSSGGYFVGACDPRILQGKASQVNPIS